ncbi:MAG: tRNA (adenosine(37)-N6)-dimethylallyltransferase MiaA [Flavobacterium sp.]|nr:MAG: tRNA (adenosine(37)-N6)-dimethylallyltransferase MiaA [Flavobacterium sp.]
MPAPLVIILGPTASGKTQLATNLAYHLDGEIISADSRQIFKNMDIGTGKDLGEYVVNDKVINHHLIDIKNAGEFYNVNAFKEDFYQAFSSISEAGKLSILCGGTGMYIHSILQDQPYTAIPINESLRAELIRLEKTELQSKLFTFDPKYTAHVDLNSNKRLIRAIEIASYLSVNKLEIKARPEINPIVIGLTSDIEFRRERILNRLEQRLETGLIEEVERLLAKGVSADALIFYGLEYKFVIAFLNKELGYEELKTRLGIAICQYAKRQMTFFRKMEKDGVNINWLNTEVGSVELLKQAKDLVKDCIDLA